MHMRADRLRRVRGVNAQDGFTLIELVIAVAILGIVSAALFEIVFQYLKVSATTETRLNESSDLQFVSAYWQNDVSSLGLRPNSTFDPSNTVNPAPSDKSVWVGIADPGGCGTSISGAQPIVSFAWDGYPSGAAASSAWIASTQRAAYVAVPNATGSQYLVERVWCGSGTVPVITVARTVTSWSVLCDGSTCGASLPSVVTLTLHVQDKSDPTNTGVVNTGTDVTLTGERRQTS